LQGAPIDSETQGVALGWSTAALSAPKSKICKSEFTSHDGWLFARWLLKSPERFVGRGFSRDIKASFIQGF
jgi:hypothetical protein